MRAGCTDPVHRGNYTPTLGPSDGTEAHTKWSTWTLRGLVSLFSTRRKCVRDPSLTVARLGQGAFDEVEEDGPEGTDLILWLEMFWVLASRPASEC